MPPAKKGSATPDGKPLHGPLDIASLERSLAGVRSRLEAKLARSKDLASRYLGESRALEADLNTLESGLTMAAGDSPFAISLLYKRAGSREYIKGRCWWNGKQREVQIGSIPVVLATIRGNKKGPKVTEDLPWDALKQNRRLIEYVKELGRQKLRSYIAKQLQLIYQPGRKAAKEVETPSDVVSGYRSTDKHVPTQLIGAGDWYSRWHQTHIAARAPQ